MSFKKGKEIIEYRNYYLPSHFPLVFLSGPKWKISDIPSERLHFHNCLEIGICHSGSGTLRFCNGQEIHFFAGDITCIPRNTPHTTFSDPGANSRWSYLFFDPRQLFIDLLQPNSPLFFPSGRCKKIHHTCSIFHQYFLFGTGLHSGAFSSFGQSYFSQKLSVYPVHRNYALPKQAARSHCNGKGNPPHSREQHSSGRPRSGLYRGPLHESILHGNTGKPLPHQFDAFQTNFSGSDGDQSSALSQQCPHHKSL